MCASGKVGYSSAQEAARVARLVMGGTHSVAARKSWCSGRLAHYRCPMCSSWHIGHERPQGKRA